MNREIKFRGKRVDNGNWVHGHYYYKFRTQQHVINCSESEAFLVDIDFEVIPETVGQYTGLKDKNNKEAYEKDYDADGNMINWCDICCGYQFFQIDIPTGDIISCHNCEGNFMLQDYINDFEIIGNIHENKNILQNG